MCVTTQYFPVVLLALGMLLLAWVSYVRRCHSLFARLGILGPRPTFLVGNALSFSKKFSMDVFKEWTKQYGPVFGFYEGLRPSVVVCCPHLAYKILVKHFNNFSVRPVINPFRHELQDLSLQNVSGQLWKRQRQAVSAGMTSMSIKEMFPAISDVSDHLISLFERAASGHPEGFFVDDIIERYSLDWFSQAALGYHSDALTNEKNILLRYMRASHDSMSPENAVTGVAKLFPLMTSVLKPFDRHHKKMSVLQTRHITDFVRSLKSDVTKLSACSCHSIIYNLLTRKVSDVSITPDRKVKVQAEVGDRSQKKTELAESEIVGEVSGLVGGGVGPFSSALTFCLYCLAVYRTEQDRLRTELETVTNVKKELCVDDLSKLSLMERFIKETLRWFPVAPGECVQDCVLDGVRFRKGMVVRVMFSCMYSQEQYFSHSERFLPDRFEADEHQDATSGVPHHVTPFIPFGLGPRMCVGQRLAIVALKLSLAKILTNFQIDTSHVTQIPLRLALRPFLVARDGVHVKIKKIVH